MDLVIFHLTFRETPPFHGNQTGPPTPNSRPKRQWWLRIQQKRGGVALGGGWELGPLDSHATHAPSFVVAKKLTRTHGKI